jgi:hypothetical protein
MLKVRRAAGTRALSDLLRHPGDFLRRFRGLPFGDPSQDLAAFRRGESVAVSASRLDVGRMRHGALVLQLHDEAPRMAWQRYSFLTGFGQVEPFAGPVRWLPDRPVLSWKVKQRVFEPIGLLVGEVEWLLAVPKQDLPFLRMVIPPAHELSTEAG